MSSWSLQMNRNVRIKSYSSVNGWLSGTTTAESIRGTKGRGSEIWRSRVFPVCAQQEALTQLEFCDTQRCGDAREQHLPVHRAQSLGKEQSGRAAEESASTRLQFPAIQCYFRLPDSLHGSGFDLRQPLQLDCQLRNLRPGATGSRHPGLERQPGAEGRTLEDGDREEGEKWKPPTRQPLWPWMLAYNSALTSSSGHPVALVTMIPEGCPPCHHWNMETASFKYRSHCFLCFFSHCRPQFSF